MNTTHPLPKSLVVRRFLIVVLLVVVLVLALRWYTSRPAPNRNRLAIGPLAQSAPVIVAIQEPLDLNFKSKNAVLLLRTMMVYRHRELIVGEYQPSDAVFGQIESGKPWWGLHGHVYYGSGEKSIEGPAEEGRFLLNPFLLVAADLSILNMLVNGNELDWDRNLVTAEALTHPAFPLFCGPHGLTWYPGEARAEAIYDVTGCIRQISAWTPQYRMPTQLSFDLIAYNARDMNLNYVYVAYDESRNISKYDRPTRAFKISHFIHVGGSCGYPGGCNNMSPPTPEIDGILIDRLPAQAVVHLWRDELPDIAAHPDMTFILHFD